MPNLFRTPMRAQFDFIVNQWAIVSTINRTTKSTDATGQVQEAENIISITELLWIQPISGNSDVVEKGIDDKTTHIAYQKHSGLAIKVHDIIIQAIFTNPFDVVRQHVFESHRLLELQLVDRQ